MNVICILLDTLRRDHLGCYGNTWIETPNLDRFSQNGALFSNSYISSYPCMPARQDLWTGQLNFLRRGWSPLEFDQQDLLSLLKENGKTSMLITDHYHMWQYGSGNYHCSFSGMELIRGQERDNWKTGPDIPIRYPSTPEKLNPHWEQYARNTAHFEKEEDYFASQVFQKSMDWVEENRNLQDFFLMIDCFDPHEPFDPPPGYAERYLPGYSGNSVKWPSYGPADAFTEEEQKQIHALYCGEVTYVDHWFGKFYEKLEQLGMLENTMVIVTSDHGFLFGEHNWIGKHARILYQDIARTPLLIHHPEIEPGTQFSQLVQMSDLTSTILQTMNISNYEEMPGRSLVPLWQGYSSEDKDIRNRTEVMFGVFGGPVYCTDGEWVLVKKPVNGNWPLYWYTNSHYNHWDMGQQNLYRDSRERLNQWDGMRFPTQYPNVLPDHAPPNLIRSEAERTTVIPDPLDELYHITSDPEQKYNKIHDNPEIRDKLTKSLSSLLAEYDAPIEQWERLGLESLNDRL